ncbi:MAG: signal peptidase I [Thermodesulfobacteriota bacterium]
MRVGWKQFLFPEVTKGLAIRAFLTAALAYLFFAFVCIPMRVSGRSMEPLYHGGQFLFCWAPSYWLSEPRRFDVVFVQMTGRQVVLLKRVAALAGETVGFQNGALMVDGRRVEEAHVKFKGNWNLPGRKVKPGNVYVIGDNRAVSMDVHVFGQTPTNRILGTPLSW